MTDINRHLFLLLLLFSFRQIEANALSWSDLDATAHDSLLKVCRVLQLTLKGIAESMNRADELVASMKIESQALKAAQARDEKWKAELVGRYGARDLVMNECISRLIYRSINFSIYLSLSPLPVL